MPRPGMPMRSVALFTALLLFSLVAVSPMTAVAQTTIDRPEYAVGDFWSYDIILGEPLMSQNLGEFQDLLENFTIETSLEIRVEAMEEVMVDGTPQMAYVMSQELALSVDGTIEMELAPGEFLNATVNASVTVDNTNYLTTEGLETLMTNASLDVDLSLGVDSEGIVVTIPVTMTGYVALDFDYLSDDWSFPWEVGTQGSEVFEATGMSYLLLDAFGNMTETSTPLWGNATVNHEVEREAMITVEAGTFSTLAVRSTVVPENLTESVGSDLAYWASQVGAPVRHEFWNESGELLALNLTAYRYQATEGFQIFGVDAIIFIPIVVAVGAVVAIVVILLMRRS